MAKTEKKTEKKVADNQKYYGTGRRKTSVARVWISQGSGNVVINGDEDYFDSAILKMIINQPFAALDRLGAFDIYCTVKGGGLSGQAGAVRHAISRALVEFSPEFRKTLRKLGFLTRDARKVERKKYGRHKARKATQFSKR